MKKSLILLALAALCGVYAQNKETVVQDSAFSYESDAAKVADANASDRSAGRMNVTKGWTMKYFVPKTLAGEKTITVSLRSDLKDAKGTFVVGIYDKKIKKIVLAQRVKIANYAGTAYKDLNLGKWNFSDSNYIFISSLSPKHTQPGSIFVDKITFK